MGGKTRNGLWPPALSLTELATEVQRIEATLKRGGRHGEIRDILHPAHGPWGDVPRQHDAACAASRTQLPGGPEIGWRDAAAGRCP